MDLIQPTIDNEQPKGLMAELEREALGKMSERTFSRDYLNREDRIGEMAAYVLETYKPHLITMHLLAVDHFQHVQGREGNMVYKALAAADRAIGKVVEAARRAGVLDKTAFIITGDHGFVDLQATLSPKLWLVENGLMEEERDRGDWKATFHMSGASAFLYLKDPKDKKTLNKVRGILENVPPRYRKLFRVVEREELDRIGAAPDAHLALAPMPGIDMSPFPKPPLLKASKGGAHGFYPDFKEIKTGFVAWGAGIRKGKTIHQIGLEDVAPVVAYLLGVDFDAPDGVLYPSIVVSEGEKQRH